MQDRPLRCYVKHRAETSGDGVRTEWSCLAATRIAIQNDRYCSRVLPLSGRQCLECPRSSAGSVQPGWLSGRECRVNARYSAVVGSARLWKAAQQFESVRLWRAARTFIPGRGGPLIVRETGCVQLWKAVYCDSLYCLQPLLA
ncbi:hypothetical protein PoB_005610600 [Plakobranchus ocellatus]|uniref:Uncharacterized protein n=1 Tax=Plakobranchus ocellatus TaxID=259542 RepID=A0AAV4CA56_9GAST|nr:hypothetical protein PoB_005610600 [Plakobranchus ocellatus]